MAKEAMRLGAERARRQGAVVVALRNSSHVGRVGAYGEQCAAMGLASVHFVNVGDHAPHQAPFGCGDARLGTNPFCAALPGGPDGGPAVLLDMATTTIAFGKARVARNKGLPVPPETVIDKDGRPTTDPVALVDRHEGALRSFGAHKGSGLAVVCELLGGALTGGMSLQPAHPRQGGIVNSMLSVVMDPAAFGDPAAIGAEVAAMAAWIKASPPAEGFGEVLLPGEPERRARAVREAEGVPIDDKSLADILAAAEGLGVPRAELDRIVGGA
jgi:hydroxycarboxylate dehydrogenase B